VKKILCKAYRRAQRISKLLAVALLATSISLDTGLASHLTKPASRQYMDHFSEAGMGVIPPSSAPYITSVLDEMLLRFKFTNEEISKLDIRVVIINSAEVNAYALPDGTILLPLGMLKKVSNEGSLAGVVGHEISHIKHKDFEGQFANICLLSGVFFSAFGLGGIVPALAVLPFCSLSERFIRRQREYWADENSVSLMKNAGYNHRDFATFLATRLARESYIPPVDDFTEAMRTHPVSYKRALRILSQ